MQPVNTEHIKEEKKIPNLRFPGFKGEWSVIRLGDETKKIGSGVTPRGGSKVYKDKGILFIRSQNVNHDRLILEDATFIPEEIHEQMRGSEVYPSDILLNITGASIGRSCVVPYDFNIGNVNQHVCIIRLINDQLPKFFQTFLSSSKGQKLVYQGQAGGGREGLNFQSIKSFKITIPSLPEQKKIASFLSAVDQKIQQLTRKKELLEQYKKGVMQKIFSREIRFKDENGNDFPDWEEKQLGDILTFISTNSLSRNDLNYDSGEIKNIHYGDIHTTFKMGFDVEKEKVPFINEEVDLRNISKDQFCQVGDIVVADASEDYSDIGKAIEVLNVGNERIVSGLHTFLARDTAGQTIRGFKGYLFQTWQIRKQIMKVAQGISVLGISKKNLAKVEFLLPCREEQGKITTLLKNIDKRIANTLTQITQTQKFKNGLLQQMFV